MKKNSSAIRTMVLAMMAALLCSSTIQAKVVSEDWAASIAGQLMSVKGKKLSKKRLAKAGMPDEASQPYYIFTGNDGKGFVIVAADDIARPILGYSADAELTQDGELPAPMQQWLKSISKQIQKAQEDGVQQSADVAEQWMEAGVGNTIVQLQTAEWGQGAPFNNYCPIDQDTKTLTGCVPTAYAILMKYYNYPLSGKGNVPAYVTPTQGISVAARTLEHSYDWDDMPMKYAGVQTTSMQDRNVAMLLADIGTALQVDYAKSVTGGRLGRMALLKNFDFFPGTARLKDAYSAEEWNEMMRMELNKERPVVYRAEQLGVNGGHAFLLDGYTDEGYFSVNWGWNGSYNGLFTLDALTPGSNVYSDGQVAYLNTVPMPMSDTAFLVEMNGQAYPTLTAAIDDAPQGNSPATINLLADTQAESLVIPEGKNITLNIGNHHIDTQYGFNNYGRFTVNGTEESLVTARGNISIYDNSGTLNITGGTHKNISEIIGESNYRRCVWTAAGSDTKISNVTCESPGQTICVHGKTVIESGTFICTGNAGVVHNYGTTSTLTINGGTYQNVCPQVNGSDFRRCVWTAEGSNTVIRNVTCESPGQAVCTNGTMTIDSGTFTCTGNAPVVSNYNTASALTINGGTFQNICMQAIETDYRRSLWTTADSETKISNATFVSPREVVNTHGKMTIESGTFTTTGNSSVISNYSTSGFLTISGGTFENKCPSVDGSDYRRCVWTDEGSQTVISNGDFKALSQVICVNGRMTIASGTFTCAGNSAVVSNYSTTSTLAIIGGKFVNICPSIGGTDYRRCIWSKQGSNTFLGHAYFENQFGAQTLCFNGNASINGAEIINNTKYGCLVSSGSRVVINDCKLYAPYMFYLGDYEAEIICRGGYYSDLVDSDYLDEGYKCVGNPSAETSEYYPYIVQEIETGIASPKSEDNIGEAQFFNLQGIRQSSMQKGVNIILYPDGTTRKVLNK